MRILEKDLKAGRMRLQIETLDDLWVLYNIIKEGDVVYAKTTREVKVGEGSPGRRIPMVLGVRVKGVEFQQFSDKLRVKGVVVEGPEEYGVAGKHHTLSLGVGDIVDIIKEAWHDFELEYVEKSILKKPKTLIVAVDFEESCIAVLTDQGVNYVWDRTSNIPSKAYRADYELLIREHINSVISTVLGIASRERVDAILVVGPGDLKYHVKQRILEELSNVRVYVDTTTTGSCQGVKEALNRDVIKTILGDVVLVKATSILEEFKKLLVKDHDMVAYGIKDVYEAVLMGAVGKLLVLDELLRLSDDNERKAVYEVLENAYKRNAEVVIVPSNSDIGAELAGFGGVVAILRFRLQRT